MYKLLEDLAIVQTVDILTPIVDDPYVFGQIAAANSLSDIYTMGARPLTALNIVSYPCAMGIDALGKILQGGAMKVLEAGAVVVGGHSIEDPEPKYGLAATGVVDPRAMVMNSGARPGDKIILTKKLGTGIISHLMKERPGTEKLIEKLRGKDRDISDEIHREAIESMLTLNATASRLMCEVGVHACTDVTGFALLGHAHSLASASGVDLRLEFSRIPAFDGVLAFAGEASPGGAHRNRNWVEQRVELDGGLGERELFLLCDPQTSGGLLIAVHPDKAATLLARLHEEGVPQAAIIGEVSAPGTGKIKVEP